jgi:hypothetical protein
MTPRKTYAQGKIDGRDELVELINDAPPIVAETPPLTITDENVARMKVDIADNFQDLSDEDRTQILDYITARAINYITTV